MWKGNPVCSLEIWIIISKITANLNFYWTKVLIMVLCGSLETTCREKHFRDKSYISVWQCRTDTKNHQKWSTWIIQADNICKCQPTRLSAASHCFEHFHHLYTASCHRLLRHSPALKTTVEKRFKELLHSVVSIWDLTLWLFSRGLQHYNVSKRTWVYFKSSNGDKRDMSYSSDDDDAQSRPKIVPIIYHFETWRQIDLSF